MKDIRNALISACEYEIDGVKHKLTPASKLICIRLVQFFSNDNPAPVIITQSDLANLTGLESKSVGNSLREFVETGMLTAVKVKIVQQQWLYTSLNSVVLYNNNGESFKTESYNKDIPEGVKAKQKNKVNEGYYLYVCYYNGVPVYVGKGKGDRWIHCLSGKSSNAKINQLYFETQKE